MRELELEGWGTVLLPTPEETAALFAGKVRAIAEHPVLEPEYFCKSGFEYARARRLLDTPNAAFVLGIVRWFPPSFQKWSPLQLWWPEGKPDLERETVLARRGPFPLQVHVDLFHCFDCQLDGDGFLIRLEVYPPGQYPGGSEVEARLKRCPECGGGLKNPGLVEVCSTFARE